MTPSSPSPHSLHLCQRAPSCGNNVRLALLLTGCRSQSSAQFLRGDQEPWAFRGGLAGEFQVSNALNLQQSNGKKRVLWAKKTMVICAQVWRALVCRRWADWNGSGFITSGFHPLHLFSKEVHVLVLLWDIVSLREGNGWPEPHPDKIDPSQCLAWHFLID